MSTDKAQSKTSKNVLHRLNVRRWFVISAAFALIVVGGAAAYAFAYAKRIVPHTMVAGVSVGGLHPDEAARRVAARVAEFNDQNIELVSGSDSWTVQPKDIGVTIVIDALLDEAYAYGHRGPIAQQVIELFAGLVVRRSYPASVQPLSDEGQAHLREHVFGSAEKSVAETDLRFTPGDVSVVPGEAGIKVDLADFQTGLQNAFNRHGKSIAIQFMQFQPQVTEEMAGPARARAQAVLGASWTIQGPEGKNLTLDANQVAEWLGTEVLYTNTGEAEGLLINVDRPGLEKALADWGKTINRAAQNARLKGEMGKVEVVQEGIDGYSLDIGKTADRLNELWVDGSDARTIQAVIGVARPEVRADTLESLGIKERVGTATTDFSGSPENRKFNIGLGQQRLNGILIKDGEVFKTVPRLAPIDEASGWKPELVIKGNRTKPEAGGGLCQVSTTLFRSVLNAGLPIVQRTNHSYRVGYYERVVGPGLDATVYDANPDFQWRNDTGKPIFVQSEVKGTKITFELFGTSDGRVSTISAPTILEETPPGDPIYLDTDTMYKGETKQVETPHSGAKTLVTYTVQRGGQEVYKKEFRSNYRPWPAQYLVGTKDKPVEATPSPSPSPTPAP